MNKIKLNNEIRFQIYLGNYHESHRIILLGNLLVIKSNELTLTRSARIEYRFLNFIVNAPVQNKLKKKINRYFSVHCALANCFPFYISTSAISNIYADDTTYDAHDIPTGTDRNFNVDLGLIKLGTPAQKPILF